MLRFHSANCSGRSGLHESSELLFWSAVLRIHGGAGLRGAQGDRLGGGMKRLVLAGLGIAALSSPAAAQSCARGSSGAFSVIDWSVESAETFGMQSAALTVTLQNDMLQGFRMVDASIQFRDALGGSIGGIEIPRTTKAGAGETFEIAGTYSSRDLAIMTEMHRDDVIVTACVVGAISDTGDVIEHPLPAGATDTMAEDAKFLLQAAAHRCWTPPPGAILQGIEVSLAVGLRPEGTVASIDVTSLISDDLTRSTAFSAQRAVERCAPYTMLPAAFYDQWKLMQIEFDASNL